MALSSPITYCLLPITSRRRAAGAGGMTMIELCIVMGIVTVLMAMVVGLNRHVNEIVKIRRAQADLGEWHESLDRWHLQFGEYPCGNPQNDNLQNAADPTENLRLIIQDCYVTVGTSNLYFQTFIQGRAPRLNDPWEFPYIYSCDPGGKSYTLYSCGADSRSTLNGQNIPSGTSGSAGPTVDPTLDDIYFER